MCIYLFFLFLINDMNRVGCRRSGERWSFDAGTASAGWFYTSSPPPPPSRSGGHTLSQGGRRRMAVTSPFWMHDRWRPERAPVGRPGVVFHPLRPAENAFHTAAPARHVCAQRRRSEKSFRGRYSSTDVTKHAPRLVRRLVRTRFLVAFWIDRLICPSDKIL